MTKNKKLVVVGLTSVLGLGVVTAFANGKAFSTKADPCAHENVEFYAAVAPTLEKAGKHQHWACCDCGTRWTDSEKTNAVEDSALTIAAKTAYTAVADADVTDTQMLYLNAAKIKCYEQRPTVDGGTGREFVKVDGRLAARFSANESLFDLMNSTNYGGTDFRFQLPSYQRVIEITFDYKLWDINYEKSSENLTYKNPSNEGELSDGWKYNTKVHTTAAYEPVKVSPYIVDNQWHTQTIEVPARDIEFFQLMSYHFNGEMYVSNVNFRLDLASQIKAEDATPAAGDLISNVVVYEKSVAAGATSDKKSIKNMTKTDAARYVTVADKNGADRTAMYFKGEMGEVTVSDGSNNYGFAEFRIALGSVDQKEGTYEKGKIIGLAFDYRYNDTNNQRNTIIKSDDKSYNMKSYVEYKTGGYTNVTKDAGDTVLVNDSLWHTCVVEVPATEFAAALIKIFAFNGELLVTNFQYVTDLVDYANQSAQTLSRVLASNSGYVSFDAATRVATANNCGEIKVTAEAIKTAKAVGETTLGVSFKVSGNEATTRLILASFDGDTWLNPSVTTADYQDVKVVAGGWYSLLIDLTKVSDDLANPSFRIYPRNESNSSAPCTVEVRLDNTKVLTQSPAGNSIAPTYTGKLLTKLVDTVTGDHRNGVGLAKEYLTWLKAEGYKYVTANITWGKDDASAMGAIHGPKEGGSFADYNSAKEWTVDLSAISSITAGFTFWMPFSGGASASSGSITVVFTYAKTDAELLDVYGTVAHTLKALPEAIVNAMKTTGRTVMTADFDCATYAGTACTEEKSSYRLVGSVATTGGTKYVQKNGIAASGSNFSFTFTPYASTMTAVTFTVRCWHNDVSDYTGHVAEGTGCWKNISETVVISNMTFAA